MRLSKLLKTKNNTQCKTHHQKMEQSCGSVEGIIKKFLPTSQVVEEDIPGKKGLAFLKCHEVNQKNHYQKMEKKGVEKNISEMDEVDS